MLPKEQFLNLLFSNSSLKIKVIIVSPFGVFVRLTLDNAHKTFSRSLAQCKYSTDIQYDDDNCSDIVINDLRQIQVNSLYSNSVVEQS